MVIVGTVTGVIFIRQTCSRIFILLYCIR